MADTCRPVDVDGETILVRGSEAMTDEDRGYFAEIIRAAKAKVAADRLSAAHTADLARQNAHFRERPMNGDDGRDE
jgi:hypothetical protein